MVQIWLFHGLHCLVVVILFSKQIYNAHILTNHYTCNIIRWWLSGKCKAHLADNSKTISDSKDSCHHLPLIRHCSETFVLDRCLIDVNQKAFPVWDRNWSKPGLFYGREWGRSTEYAWKTLTTHIYVWYISIFMGLTALKWVWWHWLGTDSELYEYRNTWWRKPLGTFYSSLKISNNFATWLGP